MKATSSIFTLTPLKKLDENVEFTVRKGLQSKSGSPGDQSPRSVCQSEVSWQESRTEGHETTAELLSVKQVWCLKIQHMEMFVVKTIQWASEK